MKSYPEFVGIDATFKLLDVRAAVSIMVVEDSEGSTEIVGVCILMAEDKPSMQWYMNAFKKVHTSTDRIKCVMADKDLLERDVVRDCFPSANVLICVFHSLRTFNREITCDKLAITPGQRDSAKEIFQKMVYADSEAEYNRLYEEIKMMPRSLVKYFDDNWHSIKNEWTLSENYMQSNFLNVTNNRIESLNQKIKSVVKRYSTLENFVEHIFVLIVTLNSERDHKAAYTYHKVPVVHHEKNSPEYFYSRVVTRYAFKFVNEELGNRAEVKITEPVLNVPETFRIANKKRVIVTNPRKCSCIFHTSMRLPCR